MSQIPAKTMVTQVCQLIVLQPQGRLDLHGCKTLEKQLAGLVTPPRHLWVIDLAQVDFMDSYGLVILVKALKVARKTGCRLLLCNIQASVRLIFELTQLDSVFEIFETYDAVLTTINGMAVAA